MDANQTQKRIYVVPDEKGVSGLNTNLRQISENLATLQGQNGPIAVPDRMDLRSSRGDVNLTLKSGTDFSTNMAEFYTADGTRRSRIDNQGRFYNEFSSPWDDVLVPLSTAKATGGGAIDPTWTDISGGNNVAFAWYFGAGNEHQLNWTAQLPHRWKEGSYIYPHVHWYPTTAAAGGVSWLCQFQMASVGGTFPAVTTYNSGAITSAASGVAKQHQVTSFPAFNAVGHTISAILMGRIWRNGGNANDTYGADVAGLHIDFHIEIDSMGSRGEFSK